MRKSLRLQALTAQLQDGKIHRAGDLAKRFGVTRRTIYRDMQQLQAYGVPIRGTQGAGYHATAEITLPPLNLTGDELEVLRLGLSVIRDAGDDPQKQAARSLGAKLDSALAEGTGPAPLSAVGIGPRVQQHLAQVRQAISARQKLRVTLGNSTTTIRPLRLDYFGRIWRCVCWDEGQNGFQALPLSEITFIAVLPGLFVDEPGKTLRDYLLG